MIYNNIEFFNVAELEKREDYPGLALRRYPKKVRNALDTHETLGERGNYVAQQASGCEIRFVTSAKTVRVSLSTEIGDGEVVILKGDYVHSIHRLNEGVLKTLHLEEPERFTEVKEEILRNSSFSPQVWRICTGRHNVIFHGIETFGCEIRSPHKEELPSLRWLAYGSSITQGAGAFNYYNTYVQHTARRLGVDAINLGLGGACRLEKAASDFIAERQDWDFATLELGVNVRGAFSVEEFKRRAQYLISSVVEKNPEKPVVVITIYPNSATFRQVENNVTKAERDFNTVLRSIVKEVNHKNLYLIEGSDIMTRFSFLTCDGVHPSDHGHSMMGEKLADQLRSILQKK